jgi:hypothetical protein
LNLFEPFQTGLGPPSIPLREHSVPYYTDWCPPPPRLALASSRDPLHRGSMHRPTDRAPPFLPLPTRQTEPPLPILFSPSTAAKEKKGAAGNLLRLATRLHQTRPKDPNTSSSSPALVLPTTVAGAPLKPSGWAETSPLSPLHGERHPLHTPSPLDQCITLSSSSLGYRNPPRSPSNAASHFQLRCLVEPGHLSEPPPSSPCPAPLNFATGASPGYPTPFHPLPGCHRPHHGIGRPCGDHAASVHHGDGWHALPRPIVAMGWAGQRKPGEPFLAATWSRPPVRWTMVVGQIRPTMPFLLF